MAVHSVSAEVAKLPFVGDAVCHAQDLRAEETDGEISFSRLLVAPGALAKGVELVAVEEGLLELGQREL